MRTTIHVLALVVAIGIGPAVQADHHHDTVKLEGVWNVTASTDQGSRELTWTFKKDGDKLAGASLDRENGNERDFDRVTVKAKKVTIEMDIEADGRKGVIKIEAEEKKPGKLIGKWSITGDDGTDYMSGDMSAVKEVLLAGEWGATAFLPDGGVHESVLKLTGKNSSLKGLFDGLDGETEIDKIAVKDDGIRMEFDFQMDGNTINCVLEFEANGSDKLAGKWVVIGDDGSQAAEGEWSAVRKPAFAGVWNVVATVPDSPDYHGTLTLVAKDGKYSGTSKNNDNGDTTKLSTFRAEGRHIKFTVPFEQGESTGTITVEAKQQKDGSLDGEWVLTGTDDVEYARGEWKATRK